MATFVRHPCYSLLPHWKRASCCSNLFWKKKMLDRSFKNRHKMIEVWIFVVMKHRRMRRDFGNKGTTHRSTRNASSPTSPYADTHKQYPNQVLKMCQTKHLGPNTTCWMQMGHRWGQGSLGSSSARLLFGLTPLRTIKLAQTLEGLLLGEGLRYATLS